MHKKTQCQKKKKTHAFPSLTLEWLEQEDLCMHAVPPLKPPHEPHSAHCTQVAPLKPPHTPQNAHAISGSPIRQMVRIFSKLRRTLFRAVILFCGVGIGTAGR